MLPFLQVSDLPKPAVVVKVEKEETTKPVPYVIPPVEYTVVENDNLTKIATAHNTTVQRLWEKNLSLTHPDVINVGDKLVIPTAEEVLTPRELPAPPVPAPVVTAPQNVAATPVTTNIREKVAYSAPRGASSGNTYSYGWCTWHAKNMRPDLPNNLGNADTWFARASAQGIPTGYAPRAGAIAQTKGSMHVAYVTGVNADGTVNLSEMAYKGWGVVSTRTAPASQFYYIY